MSEYDIEYMNVKGKDNVLADGMSRIPISTMSESSPNGDWEDVAMAGEAEEDQRKRVDRQGLDSRRK